ncbi:hypothetical protein QMK33_11035 [Hymenobacter sp. H14-R3]|uniref:hypothetical protein n=1 Tax=Hymenobacter sp. H14-R3 TaxID=3046308 RepID=UPI0024BB6E88|nr:hypothetical protein [Hymenobacter sp. H14-R3]MDJ0365687.1 hypothetical protein [Hymenobacter sp. H14-R3]
MTATEALAVVCDCLLGPGAIPAQLRQGLGLDKPRFAALVAALRLLTSHYAPATEVPKRLALCLVDVYGGFSFREGFYPGQQAAEIEDAGILLQNIANELFS